MSPSTRAPDDDHCLAALRAVQGLSPEAFERALTEEIGASMIQVMNALVRALHPQDDDEAVHKKLHLMMVSFLLARRT